MKTLPYAIRFLTRSKSYTIINLLGLAFSLACCIILMRYIHRELTVDTHCVDREQVYAIHVNMEGSEHMGGVCRYDEYDPIKLDESKIEVKTTFTSLNEDFLTENLSGESKKKFLDFCNAWSVVNGESNLDSFIMGFRLGAKFTYDTFVNENAPFQDLLKEV